MNPDFLVIDLFCGAGGTTTGFEKSRIGRRRLAKVIACVNHDEAAISSHSANHRSVLHFTEDIRTLNLGPLIRHVERMTRRYPDAKLVLWASLECTNFSKAKGGQPRDADSRTLADHLLRYIESLGVDYVMIENVEEFMSWGPLDDNGRPISKQQGSDFINWVDRVKGYGYEYEHRLINSADFGAYTSRVRYFAVFARYGMPIAWPEATHAKKPQTGSLFSHSLRKWKPVREVLDLEDEGREIFEREKPLSEKTLQRIYAGLIKYVAGGKDAFLMKMNTGNPGTMCTDPESPAGTLTTKCHQALTRAFFVQRHNGDPMSKVASVDTPARTITTTGGNLNLVQPAFIVKYLSNSPRTGFSNGADINEPCPTVTCQNRLATVFLSAYHGNGHNCTGSDQPAPTVMAADALAKVQAHWIDMQHSQGKQSESVEQPVGSVLTVPKKNLVTAAFLTNHNYDNTGTSVNDPAPTLLASRRHYYIINPSWAGSVKGASIKGVDEPCASIVARQDKAPLYLTTTESGEIAIEVYESDSETTVLIKQFMALYGIARITMRMLKVVELKRIMGLPDEYILNGPQSKQKWMIGNMVHPVVPQYMARALSRALTEMKRKKAA